MALMTQEAPLRRNTEPARPGPRFDTCAAVADYHLAAGLPVRKNPMFVPEEARIRHALFTRLLDELYCAVSDGNDTLVARTLATMLYSLHGDAHIFGVHVHGLPAPRKSLTFAFYAYQDEVAAALTERVEVFLGELVAVIRETASRFAVDLDEELLEVHTGALHAACASPGAGH